MRLSLQSIAGDGEALVQRDIAAMIPVHVPPSILR